MTSANDCLHFVDERRYEQGEANRKAGEDQRVTAVFDRKDEVHRHDPDGFQPRPYPRADKVLSLEGLRCSQNHSDLR